MWPFARYIVPLLSLSSLFLSCHHPSLTLRLGSASRSNRLWALPEPDTGQSAYHNSSSFLVYRFFLPRARSYSIHHTSAWGTFCAYTHPHAYAHFNMTHILCMMDQHSIPQAYNHLGNPDNTQLMDLTIVMPQHIQSAGNTHQCQPPPHLPSTHSSSHSCPLPSIPSSTRVELHIPSFSSS